MGSNSTRERFSLVVSNWINGKLVKNKIYFDNVFSAIKASKLHQGKTKVYDERGQLRYCRDSEDVNFNCDLDETYA
jgi:flagellar biosynthesis/type III secretory pathway chaperone